MFQSWQELTKLSGGAPLVVEWVRLANSDITIEGGFDLPALAQISEEDQVFVVAFLRSHGSIKEMERVFGINNDDDVLDVRVVQNGVLRSIYNAREIAHMSDVKGLVKGVWDLQTATGGFIGAFLLVGAFFYRRRWLLDRVQELGKRLERPILTNSSPQRVKRHPLDVLEGTQNQVAMRLLGWRDSEAAISDDHRSHAVPR